MACICADVVPTKVQVTGHLAEVFFGEELTLGDENPELQAIEVTQMDEETAYEIGQYALRIDLVNGEVIEEEGNTLLIWKLGKDNIWRIHVDMWNSNHPDR